MGKLHAEVAVVRATHHRRGPGCVEKGKVTRLENSGAVVLRELTHPCNLQAQKIIGPIRTADTFSSAVRQMLAGGHLYEFNAGNFPIPQIALKRSGAFQFNFETHQRP
ncbi:hypothetical protein GCM10025784_26540 [Citricoccus nitrophenolicus]